MHIDTWTGEVQEQLEQLVSPAGGPVIPVSDDERNLSLPGVWFSFTSIGPTLDAGTWLVEWTVIVMATTVAPRDAVQQLGLLAGPIVAAFQPEKLESMTVTAPNISSDPIPALRFTITTECED